MTVSPPQTEINSVLALYSNGQIQEALDAAKTLTKGYPNEPLLYNISGVCYKAIGKLDEAVKNFEKALTIKPDYAEVQYNLGLTLQELGQLDAAVQSYKKALTINPDYAEAHNNLGITLKELGQLDSAVQSYKKALTINPDYAEAHNNLGNALMELGQLDAAVTSYEKILAIEPNYAEAHNNLGNTLRELGQLDAAVECFEKALAIQPDFAEAHNNLGNALKDLVQLDAAVQSYQKALTIQPDFAEAYSNLGNVLLDLKRPDEALESHSRALVLKPEKDFGLGDLFYTKRHLCIWDDLANLLKELTKKINNGEKVLYPFDVLVLIDDPAVQRKAAEIFANEKFPLSHALSKIERYPKHKKIRIGYFSADFRDHPVSDLTVELYETHDRNQFEIYAFSFGLDTKDQMEIKESKAGCFDQFHGCAD